ncbi:SLC13 family permease [Dysgonomonas massiliensis]|uniref:SLC13 family permease n=1 Tax=Dysgonomonas massiliensis TaxID=2040292 RepID=UPI0016199970|nr:SLC13 family permease [Dysgonomonas massiliensis]
MNINFIILFLTAVLFIHGKIRSDLIALCSLLALVLFGLITPTQALAGFSSSVVIMMVGLFVVGGAIFRTGLAKMISSKMLRLAGDNENILFVLVMVVTASVGAFVSNTGTVAVMLPIIVSMANSANISPRRYLMPLAFASSMGLFTLISTPPNLVIQEIITEKGYKPLEFFSFAPIGFVCLSVGIVMLFFLSKLLVKKDDDKQKSDKKGKTLAELANEYNIQQQSYCIEIASDSSLLNKTLAELKIATKYNVSIVKIVRRDKSSRLRKKYLEEVAGPNSILMRDDTLYCQGDKENIERFATENDLTIVQNPEKNGLTEFQESGIAEVYIMPNSRLINRTITEARFREEFNVNVLGVQQNQEYKLNDVRNIKLHSGDALLVQGRWSDLAELDNREADMVLVGQPLKEASKVTLDQNAPVAAFIMLLMIIAMVTNIMAPVVAVLLAAVAMVFTGCLRNMEEAYSNINWESIVLIGAMMPMATAFENTGIDIMISNGLVGYFGGMSNYALLAGIYFGTSILTLFISNTATAILFAPIAMQSAVTMGISPYPLLFAVAVGASMCFASPFSTPPNALVMSAGRYEFMDYMKVGLPLQIVMGIIMVFVLPLLFPF